MTNLQAFLWKFRYFAESHCQGRGDMLCRVSKALWDAGFERSYSSCTTYICQKCSNFNGTFPHVWNVMMFGNCEEAPELPVKLYTKCCQYSTYSPFLRLTQSQHRNAFLAALLAVLGALWYWPPCLTVKKRYFTLTAPASNSCFPEWNASVSHPRQSALSKQTSGDK